MTAEVKEGSIWTASDQKEFQVVKTYHFNGKSWVHYREHSGPYYQTTNVKEYNCYLDAFVYRFTQVAP